mmetsp:Transcript_20626/g.43107  ORF Transcript_20626/g.43107 Transcript_20626/m.43107 type:complete len:213 (+) Transcript_20626:438-1076(+)
MERKHVNRARENSLFLLLLPFAAPVSRGTPRVVSYPPAKLVPSKSSSGELDRTATRAAGCCASSSLSSEPKTSRTACERASSWLGVKWQQPPLSLLPARVTSFWWHALLSASQSSLPIVIDGGSSSRPCEPPCCCSAVAFSRKAFQASLGDASSVHKSIHGWKKSTDKTNPFGTGNPFELDWISESPFPPTRDSNGAASFFSDSFFVSGKKG